MLLFTNSEDIVNRAAYLGATIEGESFPLKIKMPCRFVVVNNGVRSVGSIGDYLVFKSHNEPEIEKPEPEIKPEIKPSRKK